MILGKTAALQKGFMWKHRFTWVSNTGEALFFFFFRDTYFVRSTFDYCSPQGKQKNYSIELIGPMQTTLFHKIRNRLRLISALIGMWGSLPIIIFSLCPKLSYQKIIIWTRWNGQICQKFFWSSKKHLRKGSVLKKSWKGFWTCPM